MTTRRRRPPAAPRHQPLSGGDGCACPDCTDPTPAPIPPDTLAAAFPFEVIVTVDGHADHAADDPLSLLDDGESVMASREDGEVLWVVTTAGRKVGIGPDGCFSVVVGPEFKTAPAPAPAAEPAPPAEGADDAS